MKLSGRINYYIFGSGCCLPSLIALQSPEIDIEYYGFYKTESLEMADVIILYGCINKEAASEFERIVSKCGNDTPVLRAGRCILQECNEFKFSADTGMKIVYSIDSCPSQAEEILKGLKTIFKMKVD